MADPELKPELELGLSVLLLLVLEVSAPRFAFKEPTLVLELFDVEPSLVLGNPLFELEPTPLPNWSLDPDLDLFKPVFSLFSFFEPDFVPELCDVEPSCVVWNLELEVEPASLSN